MDAEVIFPADQVRFAMIARGAVPEGWRLSAEDGVVASRDDLTDSFRFTIINDSARVACVALVSQEVARAGGALLCDELRRQFAKLCAGVNG